MQANFTNKEIYSISCSFFCNYQISGSSIDDNFCKLYSYPLKMPSNFSDGSLQGFERKPVRITA